MNSLWNYGEAEQYLSSPLEMRAYTSRLLGAVSSLVLHGGGNTSVKVREKNIFDQEEDVIYIKGTGHDLKTIQVNGFAPVRLEPLKKLAMLDHLSDTDMVKQMKMAMTNPDAPTPSVEAILHANIPLKYVDHSHADAVVAISNTSDGEKKIKEIYGDRVVIVPYIMPGFILSKHVHQQTRDINWSRCEALILLSHGVFTFGDDAKTSYERMINIVTMAEKYLETKGATTAELNNTSIPFDGVSFATLRHRVSLVYGAPMIAKFKDDAASVGFASHKKVASIATRGPLTPDHVIHTKRIPLILSGNHGHDVTGFKEVYLEYFTKNNDSGLKCLDPAPRWAVWPARGLACFGANNKTAGVIGDIVDHTIQAIQWGEALGGWQALDEKSIFDVEYWELEQAKLKRKTVKPAFEGKVAVVSGAASGIGLAVVIELLAQGAAVAGLDINPQITTRVTHANFLGLACDVTDTALIAQAITKVAKNFGGVDILVSNAGSFPPSQKIEEITDETWDKIVDLNLTSHMKVMRAATPYLKLGFDPAVVVVASKNVLAPGPGAAAYSTSKAGITQLARVAALELGGHGIRVNVVHPDGVFDTAIWTEELLKERAVSYGFSVEEYKRRNILKVEVTSRDVARLICLLGGPDFVKTTGVQLPIDGGNERVI